MDFPNKSHPLGAFLPDKSTELAEFCGVMLGDGGVAPYQVRVTLHVSDDSEYGLFVTGLMERLFKVRPSTYLRKDSRAFDLVLSRKRVVDFLTNPCGLLKGNKVHQGADIPSWVMENREYRLACMRGLFDTDGSVFAHVYSSKGKRYTYKKLGFTSASAPLLQSARAILSEEGIRCRYGSRNDIRIESISSVRLFFERIGSNNPKHLKRYLT